jgi:conjugative transfer region lipoprotein (TIGR03751 family)
LTGCQGSGIRDQESAKFPAAKPPQELLIPDPCHPIPVTYTRTAATEVYSQFRRLPNPDLAMYVFPHLAGSDPVPVPGYTTVFPLYQRVQYALPGERVEDY